MSINNDLLAQLFALDTQVETRVPYLRGAFNYPGSKLRSLDNLLPLLPVRKSYVEVFGGTGVVLLNRAESKLEVFNDRHSGITCFYQVLRDEVLMKQLVDKVNLTLHSREGWFLCRSTWETCNLEDPVERAYRWYISIVHSFSGKGLDWGRTTSAAGQQGQKISKLLPLFSRINLRLRNVQIENQSWQQCFLDYDNKDSVIYCDPPYYNSDVKYKHTLSELEHREMIERIKHSHGFVAISGYEDKKHIYDQYDFWTARHKWTSHQSIHGAAFTPGNHRAGTEEEFTRDVGQEVLWVKE